MSTLAIIITVLGYLALMFAVSWYSSRGSDNNTFFSGGRKSNWLLVAFAMIGSTMSGVTFVSVPGMVAANDFGYMQMCLGFIAGYLVIAFVLTPLYFKMNVVSIYEYLDKRFGVTTHKTGAWVFFISKILGAAVRLFVVCLSLQLLIFEPLGLPFALNVLFSVIVVYAYTYKGGVKSVIWTDTLKTLCMILAVVLSIVFIAQSLDINIFKTVSESPMSRIFHFEDGNSTNYFWKQFLGGLFTVVAMTGLDQDMMQRTLSCKNARESQKNLITSVFMQVVVIFLFLCLGVLLYAFASANGISEGGDKLFPAVATSGMLPTIVGVLFIIGLVAAAYGAGGSALTSLTTSFTVDIIGTKDKSEAAVTGIRKRVHIVMALLMGVVIIVFNALNSDSAITAVYRIASYTYGPLLGLFTFGIACKKEVRDKWVPLVALLAPVICLVLDLNSQAWFSGYKIGFELLIINAALTILGLCLLIRRK
ncbi:MAG: sodium:solute symporter [Bacteroidales bacterium]|nr:sodium:solute symporter [Bacteroidales bacterium]